MRRLLAFSLLAGLPLLLAYAGTVRPDGSVNGWSFLALFAFAYVCANLIAAFQWFR